MSRLSEVVIQVCGILPRCLGQQRSAALSPKPAYWYLQLCLCGTKFGWWPITAKFGWWPITAKSNTFWFVSPSCFFRPQDLSEQLRIRIRLSGNRFGLCRLSRSAFLPSPGFVRATKNTNTAACIYRFHSFRDTLYYMNLFCLLPCV